MRVYNKSSRTYQHTYIDKKNVFHAINLNPKTDAEIPDDIAKAWLKTGEVVEYVKPEEAKAKEAALKEENEKLKAELEALKKAKPEEAKAQNPDAQSDDIEELKKEAEKLGIQFAPNIGAEKLKAKIEAKKAEQQ